MYIVNWWRRCANRARGHIAAPLRSEATAVADAVGQRRAESQRPPQGLVTSRPRARLGKSDATPTVWFLMALSFSSASTVFRPTLNILIPEHRLGLLSVSRTIFLSSPHLFMTSCGTCELSAAHFHTIHTDSWIQWLHPE
ncbi:unnamed protein product [Protopolystoma xenopodis]|uniref:Uncharacterized protein n=1 Tax=Protopolystoma xenopodis TaxID=117903 RepID=A0A3S5B6W7_9PLAT|nr:unnamed protein product [Protopolystoma xenopodis]